MCLLSGNIFAVWARIEAAIPRARDAKVARCSLESDFKGTVVGLQLPVETIADVRAEVLREPPSVAYGIHARALAASLVEQGITADVAKFMARYVNAVMEQPGGSDAPMQQLVRRARCKVTPSMRDNLIRLSAYPEERDEFARQIEFVFGDDVRSQRERRQLLRQEILGQLEHSHGKSSASTC